MVPAATLNRALQWGLNGLINVFRVATKRGPAVACNLQAFLFRNFGGARSLENIIVVLVDLCKRDSPPAVVIPPNFGAVFAMIILICVDLAEIVMALRD